MRESTIKPMYAFGDTDIAARRLELLAHVFEHSTRAFLREAPAARLGLAQNLAQKIAIDLGCGPGFTTHLIAEALGFSRVVGLETSERFIELARATANAAFRLNSTMYAAFRFLQAPPTCSSAAFL